MSKQLMYELMMAYSNELANTCPKQYIDALNLAINNAVQHA